MTHSKLAAGRGGGSHIGTQSNHGATTQVQNPAPLFLFLLQSALCCVMMTSSCFCSGSRSSEGSRTLWKSALPVVRLSPLCLSFCVFPACTIQRVSVLALQELQRLTRSEAVSAFRAGVAFPRLHVVLRGAWPRILHRYRHTVRVSAKAVRLRCYASDKLRRILGDFAAGLCK